MRVDKEGMLFSGGGGVSPFATGKSTALFSSLVTSQIITTHNFREYILIFHERKLIDRLDSSGKKGCYYPSYKHRADMEGHLERDGSGALGGGGEALGGGTDLPGDGSGRRWGWGHRQKGKHAQRCSPPGTQVAASRVPLTLPITEALGAWGRDINPFGGRANKAERTPAKQGMVHCRTSDPGSSGP